MTINYQQAKRIRKASLSDIFADQLLFEKTIASAMKKTVSLKVRAKIKGYKEKFDPLNIAKMMTFGSKIGPALLGRMTGRDRKDIEYFTGRLRPIREAQIKAEKIKKDPSQGGNMKGSNEMLVKIYKFMVDAHDNEIRSSELRKNQEESANLAKAKRHKELLDALKKLTGEGSGGSTDTATPMTPPDNPNGGFFSSAGKFLKGIFGKGGEKVAEKEVAKVAEKELVKTGEKAVVKEVGQAAAKEGAKDVGKTVAKTVSKEVIKETAEKTLVKKGLGSALKKVPVLGAGIGLMFGIERAFAGDYKGAAAEVASGAVGTLPIAGTAGSLVIDAGLAARDVYKELYGVYPYEEGDDPTKRQQRMDEISGEVKKLLVASSSATPESKPTPVTPTPQMRGRGSPAPSAPATKTVAPVTAPSVGTTPSQKAVNLTNQNNDMKLKDVKPPEPKVINNVNKVDISPNGKIKVEMPDVRNHEDTFARMIFNSTVVI
jgi:hypothetical protein